MPATTASAAENAKYPSRQQNAEGYFLTGDAMRFFAGHYLPRLKDSEDPRASPLRNADLAGLPRAVITTAEFDPLRDEGEAYAEALKKAGVDVAYFREPGMVHGYFGMGAASPAAEAARQRATRGVQGDAGAKIVTPLSRCQQGALSSLDLLLDVAEPQIADGSRNTARSASRY